MMILASNIFSCSMDLLKKLSIFPMEKSLHPITLTLVRVLPWSTIVQNVGISRYIVWRSTTSYEATNIITIYRSGDNSYNNIDHRIEKILQVGCSREESIVFWRMRLLIKAKIGLCLWSTLKKKRGLDLGRNSNSLSP